MKFVHRFQHCRTFQNLAEASLEKLDHRYNVKISIGTGHLNATLPSTVRCVEISSQRVLYKRSHRKSWAIQQRGMRPSAWSSTTSSMLGSETNQNHQNSQHSTRSSKSTVFSLVSTSYGFAPLSQQSTGSRWDSSVRKRSLAFGKQRSDAPIPSPVRKLRNRFPT